LSPRGIGRGIFDFLPEHVGRQALECPDRVERHACLALGDAHRFGIAIRLRSVEKKVRMNRTRCVSRQ
jgi:hypothetical protein